MPKKFKQKKRIRHSKAHRISKSESATFHCDTEGKVIFQYENAIPSRIVSKLINHISEDEKGELCKCWGITV